MRLARALVDDYCGLVPGSIQTLKQVFNASPRFCCQFITAVTMLYDLSSGNPQTSLCAHRPSPPREALKASSEMLYQEGCFVHPTV